MNDVDNINRQAYLKKRENSKRSKRMTKNIRTKWEHDDAARRARINRRNK